MLSSGDRTSMQSCSCRTDDGDLRSRLRGLAHQRRRFGYGRLRILLRRDGITINRKKTQRLYREEGLTVRRRKGRRRAVGARAPVPVLARPSQRWSLDFVHDQLATGRRLRRRRRWRPLPLPLTALKRCPILDFMVHINPLPSMNISFREPSNALPWLTECGHNRPNAFEDSP